MKLYFLRINLGRTKYFVLLIKVLVITMMSTLTTRQSNQIYIQRRDSTLTRKLPLSEFPKMLNKRRYCVQNTLFIFNLC